MERNQRCLKPAEVDSCNAKYVMAAPDSPHLITAVKNLSLRGYATIGTITDHYGGVSLQSWLKTLFCGLLG